MQSKKAFTLIELLISVVILSVMMIFLYQSYASLNLSNRFYEKELNKLVSKQEKKKVIFLDFSLSLYKSVKVLNQEKTEDVVLFQSTNSLHDKYNPYIAYLVNDHKLYRLESLKEFTRYPLPPDSEFTVDYFGEVNSFRVYKAVDSNRTFDNNASISVADELFLVHVDFKEEDDILLKIRALNEK